MFDLRLIVFVMGDTGGAEYSPFRQHQVSSLHPLKVMHKNK